ncbi:MAG: hypothetical protein AAF317_00110 [Pseudomonadota bacterium]
MTEFLSDNLRQARKVFEPLTEKPGDVTLHSSMLDILVNSLTAMERDARLLENERSCLLWNAAKRQDEEFERQKAITREWYDGDSNVVFLGELPYREPESGDGGAT